MRARTKRPGNLAHSLGHGEARTRRSPADALPNPKKTRDTSNSSNPSTHAGTGTRDAAAATEELRAQIRVTEVSQSTGCAY